MACELNLDFARILLPAPDHFQPSSVMHELLHIRRILVDGVPRLVDCEAYDALTPEMGTALTRHDNAFEHLVIVPQELVAFPESRKHWDAVMARNWAVIHAAEGDQVGLRQLALACWPFMRYVLEDSPVVSQAKHTLESLDLWDPAESFCDALLPLLGNKEAAILLWFQRLNVPHEIASLRYFRPLEFRSWDVPLGTLG